MDYPIEVTIELTSITEDIDAQLYFDLLGFGEADALVVIESVTIDDGTLGPGISVTPTDGLITSESGQTAEFTVVLLAPPTDDVTIRMFSTNHREATVSHDSVTFSSDNWNVPQVVTVQGVADFVEDGNSSVAVVVDARDAEIWRTFAFVETTGWATADMNGDMLTYGSDFNLILDNRTNSGAAVSVVHPLGDIDLDGRLTVDDVDMLQSLTHSGKILRRADLDENYTLDANDVRVLTEDIIGISPGDANLDRSVDTMDFTIWMAKRFVADTYWSSGDFNSDGVTNVSDFKIWNDNRFRSAKTRDVEFNRRLPRAPLPHGDQGRRTTTEIQIDRPAPPP